MRRALIILLLLIVACTPRINTNSMFLMQPQAIVDADNATVRWIAIDDISSTMNYTLYNDGQVIAGQDIVDTIGNVKTAGGNKPLEDVVIEKLEIKKVP